MNKKEIIFSCLLTMNSLTLTVTGNTPQLQTQFFPEIDLSDGEYVCGLIDFVSSYSIPNVDETNNLFYYGYENLKSSSKKKKLMSENNEINQNVETQSKPILKIERPLTCIQIPVGSYELNDLNNYLQKQLNKEIVLKLEANKNTLQCEILCSQPVNFSKPNTIGSLLGFRRNEILKPNIVHESSSPADILKVKLIRIKCNIINGSYFNNQASHTIHEFAPNVAPGYTINERPRNVIYFPVTVKSIRDLTLSIIDQNNEFINFRGHPITVRLHLVKKQ